MLTSTSNHYTQKEKRQNSTTIAEAYASHVNISNNAHMKPNITGARDCCIKRSKSDAAQEAHENEHSHKLFNRTVEQHLFHRIRRWLPPKK